MYNEEISKLENSQYNTPLMKEIAVITRKDLSRFFYDIKKIILMKKNLKNWSIN